MTESPRKPIVTFFEEYGAGADYVGARVAERLRIPFVTQRFSSDDIESVGRDDEPDESGFSRFIRSFTPTAEADATIAWTMDALADTERVAQNTASVLEATRDGGVILGRSATVILAQQPGALHVKLVGPVEGRVARAAAEAGIDLERAERRQLREDHLRADMSRRHYRWDPANAQYFDVVVNTGTYTLDAAVDLVLAAYRARWRD